MLIISMMLGFSDPWVFAGFGLTVLSALFCVPYGIRNWNKGGTEKEGDYREEIQWEREEIGFIEKLPWRSHVLPHNIHLIYLAVTVYFSWLGYRRTVTVSDYLLAGRQVHPVTMGFLLRRHVHQHVGHHRFRRRERPVWVRSNVAFVPQYHGGRLHRLRGVRQEDPERWQGSPRRPYLPGASRQTLRIEVVQGFSGLMILVPMPVYTAAVLIGISRFIEVYLNIPFSTAFLAFLLITSCFVIWGLKGVLYTSAFQGVIMVVSMIAIGITSYYSLGGISEAHRSLDAVTPYVPQFLKEAGHRGFTSMPETFSSIW